MNKLFKRVLMDSDVIGRLVTTPAFLVWVRRRNIRVCYINARH